LKALVQFSRFAVVGAVATVLQYVLLWLLVRFAAADPVLASGLGFVASAVLNYELNRRLTFRSDVAWFIGLRRFAVVAAAGLVLNVVVVALLHRGAGAHYLLAQLVATVIVLSWNFLLNRLWTFEAAGRKGS